MCHDISFSTQTIEKISDYLTGFEYSGQPEIDFSTAVHHIAQAYKEQPVLLNEDGKLVLRLFEWGLIAPYMNTPESIKKYRSSMVNARSEKILEKNSAWNRLRKNRCLVPLQGIYEHRKVEGYKNKIPYYILSLIHI